MLVAEAIKLVNSTLVMTATKAVSKRFLFFKKIKTYHRSVTTNNRLNDLLNLHIHKLLTGRVNLTVAADEFIERFIKIRALIIIGTIFCKIYREGPRTFRLFASIN